MEHSGFRDLNLDGPYYPHPWEEALADIEPQITVFSLEERARQRLRWPDELTADFLQNEFQIGKAFELDESDVVMIDSLVAEKNDELLALTREYFTQIDTILKDRWATGNYIKGPYTTAGLSSDQGFFSTSTGALGWGVTITLKHEDYPDIAALDDQIYLRRDERDEIVTSYLKTRASRR